MEFYPEVKVRWIVALVCGAISVAILFLPFVLARLGWLVAPLSLIGSVMGILFGTLSLAAKEKRVPHAITGIALSLVCPVYLGIAFVEALKQI